ncbi:hypothetical protein V5799_017780 [Amblyomma americanum]|uniref:Uncharacterized protein n=1 Tax=Amblyomma americanum TaxID=6943 RepID=A0AAQ4F1M2_AMBAM
MPAPPPGNSGRPSGVSLSTEPAIAQPGTGAADLHGRPDHVPSDFLVGEVTDYILFLERELAIENPPVGPVPGLAATAPLANSAATAAHRPTAGQVAQNPQREETMLDFILSDESVTKIFTADWCRRYGPESDGNSCIPPASEPGTNGRREPFYSITGVAQNAQLPQRRTSMPESTNQEHIQFPSERGLTAECPPQGPTQKTSTGVLRSGPVYGGNIRTLPAPKPPSAAAMANTTAVGAFSSPVVVLRGAQGPQHQAYTPEFLGRSGADGA